MLGGRVARRLRQIFAAATLVVAAALSSVAPAQAAEDNYAAIVIDAKTGEVLFSRNADLQRYPASLTKMMTLYLVFEDLERGRISLTTRLNVSANAAAQPPSKLGLPAGATIRVEDAILALITRSANDIAMVIAENLNGSERAFAERMTTTARALGMTRTTFRNPHGLPNSQQVTTARDMATLGRALYDRFPQYYPYFSTPSFNWQGTRIANHNNLLGDPGVNGIKTGYTNASGYNLVTSVQRDNRYIVGVVMGGNTAGSRDAHMRELIATYMPRASTGARTAPLVVAAYAPTGGPLAPLPRPNPARTTVDPVQVAALPAAATAADAIAILAQGDVDPGNVPAAPPSGWLIQVGAFPSENSARAVLARALELEANALAGTTPYTEPVVVGANQHFRARFGGFATGAAAVAACARLTAENFDCFATEQ
ncbi:MAG: serine hydrolase [Bauldia sp.]